MSWKHIIIYSFIALCATMVYADVVVHLNINRPINDVSDKFVSFTMKPEDLYEALDGSYRKSITRMASMLSQSHIKFIGDYYFASKTDTKLRNPTKIVWKGFNKWTKAIGWSMIVPVPYTPNNWDPMHALKILNNSQAVGITDCIWQLGTDFGSSAAMDYVTELRTFNLMIDSFRHTVNNWKIMGADISSGSSPDETRRYVEMSKDLNAAFGWIESSDLFLGNSLTSALNEHDPALKVLFREKVPVWLTLPKTKNSLMPLETEVLEGLNWAQTMGDAANSGFDAIFKHISLTDWETPKYSFYVTALYKKVMGSRVFSAKPLMGMFGRHNKLYTHCASTASGGLAFMVINKQERPLQIAVKSMSKLQDTELWQYSLTMLNGHVMLNNKKLNINATLTPDIRKKQSQSMIQLKTPGMSVSFYVLPNVNLEHCHFTEVGTSEETEKDTMSKDYSYTSTDRLLKELIKETAKPTPGRKTYRQRRSLDNNERYKRFVLENGPVANKPLAELADNIVDGVKLPFKRDVFSPERRKAALEWLGKFFNEPRYADLPPLRRNIRNSDAYNMGPFFMTRDGKKTAFTKKITEIKKPEKKSSKSMFEDVEFDEEKFFKNVGLQQEPEYIKLPEGDVFLQTIASLNGDDEIEDELKIEHSKESKKASQQVKTTKEVANEMKPLRLLPTEFYEALPVNPATPLVNKLNIGSALNSLIFSEAFTKNFGKGNENIFAKNFDLKEDPITTNIEEPDNHKDEDVVGIANGNDDFRQAQLKMNEQAFNKKVNQETETQNSKYVDELVDKPESPEKQTKSYFSDYIPDNNYNFFGADTKIENDKLTTPTEAPSTTTTKSKFEELPWWDLTPLRSKRSLDTRYSASSWQNNMITKDEEPIAAANDISPRRLRAFEYKVDEALRGTKRSSSSDDGEDNSIGQQLVKTFQTQVSKLVDIVSHHVSEWYNTLAKQLESSDVETTTDIYRII